MLDTFEQSRREARGRGLRDYFAFGLREVIGLFGLPAPPSPRRWTAIAGWAVAGLGAGIAAMYVVPARYSSEATQHVSPVVISHRLVPDEDELDVTRVIRNLGPVVLSRTNLLTIVNRHFLYPHIRARLPIEDVLIRMRNAISLDPTGANTFDVRFTYWDSPSKESDRLLAQRVTQDLVAAFIHANVEQRQTQAYQTATYLKERAEVVAQQWDKLTAELRALPGNDPRMERLQLDRDLVRHDYELLRLKLSDAQVILDLEERKQRSTLQLIAPASLHTKPDTDPIWIVLTGLAAGLLLGIAVAAWRTLRRPAHELATAQVEVH